MPVTIIPPEFFGAGGNLTRLAENAKAAIFPRKTEIRRQGQQLTQDPAMAMNMAQSIRTFARDSGVSIPEAAQIVAKKFQMLPETGMAAVMMHPVSLAEEREKAGLAADIAGVEAEAGVATGERVIASSQEEVEAIAARRRGGVIPARVTTEAEELRARRAEADATQRRIKIELESDVADVRVQAELADAEFNTRQRPLLLEYYDLRNQGEILNNRLKMMTLAGEDTPVGLSVFNENLSFINSNMNEARAKYMALLGRRAEGDDQSIPAAEAEMFEINRIFVLNQMLRVDPETGTGIRKRDIEAIRETRHAFGEKIAWQRNLSGYLNMISHDVKEPGVITGTLTDDELLMLDFVVKQKGGRSVFELSTIPGFEIDDILTPEEQARRANLLSFMISDVDARKHIRGLRGEAALTIIPR